MMFGQESGIGNREAKQFLNLLLGTGGWWTGVCKVQSTVQVLQYSSTTVLQLQ